jgi:hypothetical protein
MCEISRFSSGCSRVAQMLWFEPNGPGESGGAGASATTEDVLEEPTGGISSYFQGRDEKAWRTGIPQYSRARLKNVYAGIDLVYYGNAENLEYDFIVRSGADPWKIRLAFNYPAKLDANGDLLVGGLTQRRARVFPGGKEIASEWVIGKSGLRLRRMTGRKRYVEFSGSWLRIRSSNSALNPGSSVAVDPSASLRHSNSGRPCRGAGRMIATGTVSRSTTTSTPESMCRKMEAKSRIASASLRWITGASITAIIPRSTWVGVARV